MRKQARAWLDSARDDLRVVEAILELEELTHMVAFHCQQAIEKSCKALLAEYADTAPRIHDLVTLCHLIEPYITLRLELELLDQLNELYIDARYPSDLGLLHGGKPPVALSQQMYRFAQQILEDVEGRIA